jgi:ABC-type transporter Mla subunit MlaD
MANPMQPKTNQGTPGSVVEQAKDTAANVADKAREAAANAADKARDAASAVGTKAENVTHRVGSGMESVADTIRSKAPSGGVLGTAASRVADTLESGGRYLEEEGLSGLGKDLTELIRRNPIPALLIGIGVGFLLARVTRS